MFAIQFIHNTSLLFVSLTERNSAKGMRVSLSQTIKNTENYRKFQKIEEGLWRTK